MIEENLGNIYLFYYNYGEKISVGLTTYGSVQNILMVGRI